jgi:hypothetical protein
MEINLSDEQIVELVSPFSDDVVRDRVMAKRAEAFGHLVRLMARPKPDEIGITRSETRLEPFWYGAAQAHYRYDRRQQYQVPVGREVASVTIHDEDYPVTTAERSRTFVLAALEHCVEDMRRELMLDPQRGDERDYARYRAFPTREVPTLAALAEGGAVVVPPEVRSSFLARKLIHLLMRTFQADQIHEERIDIGPIILYYRPVHAFELHWKTKDKRAIVEFDGLTGEMHTEGGQFKTGMVRVLENDALFDIGADAIGMIVPGANIAVKLGRIAARKVIT